MIRDRGARWERSAGLYRLDDGRFAYFPWGRRRRGILLSPRRAVWPGTLPIFILIGAQMTASMVAQGRGSFPLWLMVSLTALLVPYGIMVSVLARHAERMEPMSD